MAFWRVVILAAIVLGGLIASSTRAAVISVGTPTSTVPTALFDPFASLTSPLPAGQFLLPIQITGASGLQNWSFDLGFNGAVVTPLDVGGLYQSVYQSEFNASDTTLSNITSSGISLPNLLDDIAGFSSGVSGAGLLAFVLFEFLPGQQTNNPGFEISDSNVTQQVPEPGTLALLLAAVLAIGLLRALSRRQALLQIR